MRSSRSACTYLLFLLTLSVFLGLGEMAKLQKKIKLYFCVGCDDICDKCKYGSYYSDWCRKNVCYKGPGDLCGEIDDWRGTCGAGMYCQCDKCSGCSTKTLECFDSELCKEFLEEIA